jgi:hypothetical protein
VNIDISVGILVIKTHIDINWNIFQVLDLINYCLSSLSNLLYS